ncbi:hypothetical protein GMAR_ORF185 [Golden Marseillevirus]|uniref:hypothetical protein n=1 Tax=Golden Marseillevirus TaxID=1720526 RepID=UPI000877AA4A|nr:hypothetical protein GMAR_ORF185 [Golden Marseillevirus]ALX27559.1 hypothetical protein GMAR_ORF185 [Golden Marseillevirus]
MQSLQNICLSNVSKFIKSEQIALPNVKCLPVSLLEEVCKNVNPSVQIKHFGICVVWENGVMRERSTYEGRHLSGEMLKWDSKGRILEETHYKAGKRHGVSIQYNASTNSVRLVQNFSSGLLHGEVRYFSEDGVLRKLENYKMGKLHGQKTVFFDDGKMAKKTLFFYKGKKEGYSRTYTKRSRARKGNTLGSRNSCSKF